MKLCDACLALRDWASDPAVQAKIDRNLQERDENRRARCGTCRSFIRNPLFALCAKCADKAELCQHCSASLITPEARAIMAAAAERREALIDFYTEAVKLYGMTTARRLFHEMRATFGDVAVDMLILLDFRDLDYGRERRPIWTKVLGTNVFRHRHCQDCAHLPASAPRLIKASGCGHWTTARSGAWCPTCAADLDACEGCGAST
jgi:hypothetical protein